MTRFVRIDKLPKVCSGLYSMSPDGEERPEWTDEIIQWYKLNQDKIVRIHKDKNYELAQNMYTLEFINDEEATVFAMLFGG